MAKEKFRWKDDKSPVRVRHVHYETKGLDGIISEVNYWEIATGGDFRKGYITFSNEEFEKLFEKY